MEEDDGFGLWIGGLVEVIDVAVWAETTDDGGPKRSFNGLAVGACGDFAVVADADAGLQAPDKGPPRTSRGGTEDGTFFGEGLGFGGMRCGAEFAVDFVLIDVGEELIEQTVGPLEFEDVIGGEKWWEPFSGIHRSRRIFRYGGGRRYSYRFSQCSEIVWTLVHD